MLNNETHVLVSRILDNRYDIRSRNILGSTLWCLIRYTYSKLFRPFLLKYDKPVNKYYEYMAVGYHQTTRLHSVDCTLPCLPWDGELAGCLGQTKNKPKTFKASVVTLIKVSTYTFHYITRSHMMGDVYVTNAQHASKLCPNIYHIKPNRARIQTILIKKYTLNMTFTKLWQDRRLRC